MQQGICSVQWTMNRMEFNEDYISKTWHDVCKVRNVVPRAKSSEVWPNYLFLSELCQLQDHAPLDPAVMFCSCLEITKQEHHTYEPWANNPVDHTFMVRFMPTTTSPAFAETLPLLEGMKMEEDAFFLPSPLGQRASQWPQHPRLLRRHSPHHCN